MGKYDEWSPEKRDAIAEMLREMADEIGSHRFERVSFSPQAIREHYEYGESPHARWVIEADDEQLHAVAEAAISDDVIWEAFDRCLTSAVAEAMRTGAKS